MTPRASRLGFAVLGLLHQVPRSGYDVRKLFATTPLGHFSDSPGAVYPALRGLEARGFIEKVPGKAAGGRRRQAFRPTAAGRRAFRRWLEAQPTPDEVGKDLDAQLLRLAFLEPILPPSAVDRALAALERAATIHLKALDRFFEAAAPAMTPSGRLAFEAGTEGFRSFRSWARRARRRRARVAARREKRS